MEFVVGMIESLPPLVLVVLVALAFLATMAAGFAGFVALVILELREMILGVQDLSRWVKQRRRPTESLPRPPYGTQGAGWTDFSSRP